MTYIIYQVSKVIVTFLRTLNNKVFGKSKKNRPYTDELQIVCKPNEWSSHGIPTRMCFVYNKSLRFSAKLPLSY